MENYYFIVFSKLLAQAYGEGSYGAQEYSANETTGGGDGNTGGNNGGNSGGNNGGNGDGTQTTTEQTPNTGFFGQSQDMAVASITGILLLAIAIVGTIYVLVSRARRKKNEK